MFFKIINIREGEETIESCETDRVQSRSCTRQDTERNKTRTGTGKGSGQDEDLDRTRTGIARGPGQELNAKILHYSGTIAHKCSI